MVLYSKQVLKVEIVVGVKIEKSGLSLFLFFLLYFIFNLLSFFYF